jgi:hypothetical protein
MRVFCVNVFTGPKANLFNRPLNRAIDVAGTQMLDLSATDDHDNEENAVRLAEQMVRELFRRHREKQCAPPSES